MWPTKFSMLFKHNYNKLFWKFGDHSFDFFLCPWPFLIKGIGVIFTFWKKKQRFIVMPWLMSKKYTFKGICLIFLLELNFFILSHPATFKQPHKIVQIHMGHPVDIGVIFRFSFWQNRPILWLQLSKVSYINNQGPC